MSVKTQNGVSATVLRFEPHGQYVDPASGFGGYASLPISYLSESQGGMSQSATGIADLEVGGIFIPKLHQPNLAVVLTAGITLPTGSGVDMSAMTLPGYAANLIGLQSRLADYYLALPKGVTGRAGGAVLYRQGPLFLRGEAKLDVNFSVDSQFSNTGEASAIEVNLGAGYQAGDIAIMVESINLDITGDRGATIQEGAISARFSGGSIHPYGALILPLDDDAQRFLEWSLTAGAEMNLR